MPDGVYILLSVWGLLSFVSVWIDISYTIFDSERFIGTYSESILWAIDNRKKFTTVGRLIIIPVWTTVGVLLPVPALLVIGPLYLVGWVVYQTIKLVFFKSSK
jgi:hypothetical protein